jgi:hypothetical protein
VDIRETARQVALLRLLDLLPRDRPFTTTEAKDCGVSAKCLREATRAGLLKHPMRGVYHWACLADTLALRIECLKLVVPSECVVTDRTAAWLWGARMALNPGAHLEVPALSVFCPPGHRLRNGLVASGERTFTPGEVVELDGLQVTVPLRAACDLGRLLHRDQAFAAMDSLAGLRSFSVDELVEATGRFAGYRGVIQLRALAPFVDPDSQSPGESILRLRWLDVGFPRPKCQVEVPAPGGGSYWIDIGLEQQRFGAEYDGEDFHTEDDAEHDEERRDWMRRTEDWTIVVARKANIHGPHHDIDQMLFRAAREAGLNLN